MSKITELVAGLKIREGELIDELSKIRRVISILEGDDNVFDAQQNEDLYQKETLSIRALKGIRNAFYNITGEWKTSFTALDIHKHISYRDLIKQRNIGTTTASEVYNHLRSIGLKMREK